MKSSDWFYPVIIGLCIIVLICLIPFSIENCNKLSTDQTVLQIIAERCPPPIRTNTNTGEQLPQPTIRLTIIYPSITGQLINISATCIYEDAHIGILTTDIIHGDCFTIDELKNYQNLHWVMMEDL